MARRHPARQPGRNQAETRERVEVLREVLEERRRTVRAELELLSHSFRKEKGPETWDEGDRAAYEFDCDLDSARINQLTQVLEQIETALARHAEGRYGRCAVCDSEIPVARLHSLPFAMCCRDCQEAAEEASRQAVRTAP